MTPVSRKLDWRYLYYLRFRINPFSAICICTIKRICAQMCKVYSVPWPFDFSSSVHLWSPNKLNKHTRSYYMFNRYSLITSVLPFQLCCEPISSKLSQRRTRWQRSGLPCPPQASLNIASVNTFQLLPYSTTKTCHSCYSYILKVKQCRWYQNWAFEIE